MIQSLVRWAVYHPWIVLLLSLALGAAGVGAYSVLNVEAYPNPVPPLVEIITLPEGVSAEEVERQYTVPLEVALAGMSGLDHVRSQSLFGLSDIKCYFRWGTSYDAARQEVLNRLRAAHLPGGVEADISPWNAIGEVFRYTLQGKNYSKADLKTAQDWILERQFKQVPGVIDVVSFGGDTKQYHVDVDPLRLRVEGVTLPQIISATANANQNSGGQRVAIGEQAFTVRGIGLAQGVSDLGNVVVSAAKGVPIRVMDVANVTEGASPRLGIVGHDEDPDVIQGTVLMRYGAETKPTLEGIHKKVEEIRRNHVLPPGMEIVPYYDRGALVDLTTHTVIENLLVGMGLVTLVLVLFLGNLRAALITALNIPLSLLLAFSGIVLTATPANLISLGAVDFGIVVDSTVIMVENIFHHLGPHGTGSIRDRILAAAREVATPMSFSTLIIGTAFIPLFTMSGVAGVIFSPLAKTYALAIGGAILLALTLTPVLASKLIPVGTEEKDSVVMRFFRGLYRPIFSFGVRRPKLALALGAVPMVLAVGISPWLGGEFMPKLEEGNLWIRVSLPTSISLETSARYVGEVRRILRGCPEKGVCDAKNAKHPEVVTVVSQLGRPDDGTDPSGFGNIELFAPLRPMHEWQHGMTKEKLTTELSAELEAALPGAVFNFSQMISDNVEEAVSGVKGENSVKVVGPDLLTNESMAKQVASVMSKVQGVEDLGVLSSMGQPSIRVEINRQACARHGLNTGDVDAVIQAAIGGQAVTQVIEGEKRFDVVVRWKESYRNSLDAIRSITVPSPDGAQVPLAEIATVDQVDSASTVFREDGNRYIPIKFSVRGRDVASTVGEAQKAVAAQVKLPYGTRLEWTGQMNELNEALRRLMIVVPITLLLIGILVFGAVGDGVDLSVVLASIPYACSGGVLALFLTHTTFSVSASMGFVSVFGIAVQDAIIIVSSLKAFRILRQTPLEEDVVSALDKRLRPALMTTLVALLGLLPAAMSTGPGSQAQRPLAIVVIGGSLLLAFVSPLIKPAALLLAYRWKERDIAQAPVLLPDPLS